MFRSRVAEEYMKRIARGKHNISSAGLFYSKIDLLDPIQKKVCAEFGIELPNKSRTMSIEFLGSQDVIVIVADDVPFEVIENWMTKGKVRSWNIPDVYPRNMSEEKVREVVNKIIRKVNELNEELDLLS